MEAAAPSAPDLSAQIAELRALLLQQQAANQPVVPKVPQAAPARTVAELWDAYAAHFPPGLGKGKTPEYLPVHRRFFTTFEFEFEGKRITLGDQPWTALTPQMGHAWWSELREQTRKMKGKIEPVSAGYCNRIRTTGSGMFTWHIEQAERADSRVRASKATDNVTENPIHRWPRAGKEELGKRMAGFADEDQFADFLRHAHPTLAEMMTLSVWCGGMRKDEVRMMRFQFINWADKSITLPDWFVKNKVARTFPVTDACMEILERRKKTRRSEFVFASPNSASGEAVAESTMDDWVQTARLNWGYKLNGDEDVVFHHCRHTFAKWSLLLGDQPTVVMEFGGWLSYDVFKGYAKANAAMVEQSRANKNRTIREAIDSAVGKSVAPQRRGAQRARNRFEPREEKAV
jgi:integrase